MRDLDTFLNRGEDIVPLEVLKRILEMTPERGYEEGECDDCGAIIHMHYAFDRIDLQGIIDKIEIQQLNLGRY